MHIHVILYYSIVMHAELNYRPVHYDICIMHFTFYKPTNFVLSYTIKNLTDTSQ